MVDSIRRLGDLLWWPEKVLAHPCKSLHAESSGLSWRECKVRAEYGEGTHSVPAPKRVLRRGAGKGFGRSLQQRPQHAAACAACHLQLPQGRTFSAAMLLRGMPGPGSMPGLSAANCIHHRPCWKRTRTLQHLARLARTGTH